MLTQNQPDRARFLKKKKKNMTRAYTRLKVHFTKIKGFFFFFLNFNFFYINKNILLERKRSGMPLSSSILRKKDPEMVRT